MYDDIIEIGMEYIDSLVREHLPELVDAAKDQIKEAFPKIKKELLPTITKFVKDLLKSKNTAANAVETLTMAELLQIARKNIVAGANGFAVFKAEKNGKHFVYLANCKDNELLDESINKYVIIQADSLSTEIKDLFGDTDLIILK